MARRNGPIGAAFLALVLVTACGRLPTQAPPTLAPIAPNPYPADPYPTPGYGTDPGYGGTPGYGTDPNYGNPGQPMIAKIDNVKNGAFLGMGALKVQVTVLNPASMPQSATLKVSILDKGKSIKDFTERVTVPAGQSISRNYEDKRWKADNASVAIVPEFTDPNGGGYGGSYGSGGSYGNTTYGNSGYGNTTYGNSGYTDTGYGNTTYGNSGAGATPNTYPASNGTY